MPSHRRPSAVPGPGAARVGGVLPLLVVLVLVVPVLGGLVVLSGVAAGSVGGGAPAGGTELRGSSVTAVSGVEAGSEPGSELGADLGADRGAEPVGTAAAAGRSLQRRSTVPAGPGPLGGRPGDARPVAVPEFRPMPLPRLLPREAVGPLWLTPQDRAAGVLALEVPRAASGVLDVVPGSEPAPGAVGVRAVRVEVERGLAVDPAAFAATVMATLNDPRGWGARGQVSFARTDGAADVRVVLASPDLVDALCAPLPTGGEVSCGRYGHAALNARRWVEATPEFADRTLYRQYLVNHEVGHLLGHRHERCPGPGRPAPLMQQQSLRVAPCLPNGWPYPAG